MDWRIQMERNLIEVLGDPRTSASQLLQLIARNRPNFQSLLAVLGNPNCPDSLAVEIVTGTIDYDLDDYEWKSDSPYGDLLAAAFNKRQFSQINLERIVQYMYDTVASEIAAFDGECIGNFTADIFSYPGPNWKIDNQQNISEMSLSLVVQVVDLYITGIERYCGEDDFDWTEFPLTSDGLRIESQDIQNLKSLGIATSKIEDSCDDLIKRLALIGNAMDESEV